MTTIRDVVPRASDKAASNERGELAGFEIALAHLNEIDAAVDGALELGQQEAAGVIERRAGSREPSSVRHETPDHCRVP